MGKSFWHTIWTTKRIVIIHPIWITGRPKISEAISPFFQPLNEIHSSDDFVMYHLQFRRNSFHFIIFTLIWNEYQLSHSGLIWFSRYKFIRIFVDYSFNDKTISWTNLTFFIKFYSTIRTDFSRRFISIISNTVYHKIIFEFTIGSHTNIQF